MVGRRCRGCGFPASRRNAVSSRVERGPPSSAAAPNRDRRYPEPVTSPDERPSSVRPVDYKGEPLDAERGPGLGCFRFQVALLVILVIPTLGGCLLLAEWQSQTALSSRERRRSRTAVLILGIMLLSIGIGYLVSAAAAFGLGRSLGVYSTSGESAR